MRKDSVYEFVRSACGSQDPVSGVTAQEVATALGIWRNDAAIELNKLVAEGKLSRTGKKNIRFFPPLQTTAEQQEKTPEGSQDDVFRGLIGAEGSLKYQLRVAKAAVSYPPYGLNMLITGPTGSGKSYFARTIWEYAKQLGTMRSRRGGLPFVEFNCAEYADNPQLLLSHLFGYKKGAFTGAFEDKEGLVEQADGGILFLDEIHCLSSSGQEIFFTLLDTGVFHRIGDNTPRSARFMLIGATTKPLTDLLETFLRRMPVLISMPALSDRPIKERLELIEHFYSEEATQLGRPLRIKKDALNSILDYSLHTNMGALKNMVQISCAKALLSPKALSHPEDPIEVNFFDLSFQSHNLSLDNDRDLNSDFCFTDDLLVPDSRLPVPQQKSDSSFLDVYDFIEKKIAGGALPRANTADVQQAIVSEISGYYLAMEHALQSPDTDEELLGRVLLPGTIGICSELLSRAAYELEKEYPAITATLLAMHISQYVSRMRSEQPVFPFRVSSIVKSYTREIDFLQKNCEWLSMALKTPLSLDEISCLAIFLHQTGEQIEKPPVWLTLVSGCDGVAAGMAQYLNGIYCSTNVHWVSSGADSLMFRALCDNILAFHGEAGNLVFTDIKELVTLESELSRTTGVPCRVIPVLEQRLLLAASRISMNPVCKDLDAIRQQLFFEYAHSIGSLFQSYGVDPAAMQGKDGGEAPQKIILSICVTGIGSAKAIRDILLNRLSYIPHLRVVACSSLENIEQIAQTYADSLKLVVGTIDPHIPGLPFVTADRVFSGAGMAAIASLLEDWNPAEGERRVSDSAVSERELDGLLAESLRFIAPHITHEPTMQCIGQMAHALETAYYHKPLPQDLRIRLFMHAASMLERIFTGNTLPLEPEHEAAIAEKRSWFCYLQAVIEKAFQSFGVQIPRTEVFYFMLSLPETLE